MISQLEALEIAQQVLAGKTRSYVTDARTLALYIVHAHEQQARLVAKVAELQERWENKDG